MPNLYNEIDGFAAAWLRELQKAGQISEGVVDERSIKDVRPEDLAGMRRVHLFAGVSGWEYALRLAGWGDREVWTGSCPCQPFSVAGKGGGDKDARHLWPDFFKLVRERRPNIIFGEQVASAEVVGGADDKDEDLQTLQDREAVFRVLRQLQGESENAVQGLHKTSVAGVQEGQPQGDIGSVLGVEKKETGICPSECGPVSVKEAGSCIRSGPGEHPAEDRSGGMRIDGDTIRSGEPEGLERSVAGPNRLSEGIHEGQCSRDPVLSECHGECVGCGENFADCVGDSENPHETLRRFTTAVEQSAPTSLRPKWLDGVFADLEGEGYSCGAAVLPACGVGAPHKRDRLFWVANLQRVQEHEKQQGPEAAERERGAVKSCGCGVVGGVGNAAGVGRSQPGGDEYGAPGSGAACGQPTPAIEARPWGRYVPVKCADGKARRIAPEPEIFPLAHGSSNRVGILRGAGNAIVPQVAAEFIRAFLEA